MNKIFLIDKPEGITSHDVVDKVRAATGQQKVGHAGTLDPMATGLLIVLVGRGATRKQSEFMGLEKEYIAEVTFGLETDTYDAEGEVVNSVFGGEFLKAKLWDRSLKLSFFPSPPKVLLELKNKNIEETLKEFQGKIEQQVPPYSAVKINGTPLYKYAREGRLDDVELPVREVEIKEIELVEFKPFCPFGHDSSEHSRNELPDECCHSGEGFPKPPIESPCTKRSYPCVKDSSLQNDSTGGAFRSGTQTYEGQDDQLPKAKIRVVCSKGTYIRSLAHDLGQKLGTGAFLSALRRTRIGEYSVEDAVPLSSFSN